MLGVTKQHNKQDAYDPRNVAQHANRAYTTLSESRYSFDENARFHGRESIEGELPELIAGIDKQYIEQIEETFPDQYASERMMLKGRKRLGKLVEEHGEQPAIGKYLVVVLSKPSAKIKGRIGFKSSLLEAIE